MCMYRMTRGDASSEIHTVQHLVNCGTIERVPYGAHESKMNDQDEERPVSLIHSAQQSHAPSADEWVILVKDALNAGEDALYRRSSRVCIFKVPNNLIAINRKAYVPQMVSLGPYHFSSTASAKLSRIEIHKVIAVHRMISRLGHTGNDINFVVEEIQNLENDIRDCYDEVIECNREKLAWMLILDGCFLLELFRAYGEVDTVDIFHATRMKFTRGEILRDLFKLENQIPLFVLRRLLEFQMVGSRSDDVVDRELIRLFVMQGPMTMFYPFTKLPAEEYFLLQIRSVRHILGLLANIIVPSISEVESESDSQTASYFNIIASYLQRAPLYAFQYIVKLWGSNRPISDGTVYAVRLWGSSRSTSDEIVDVIPPAEELHNAGIKFRACTEEMKRIAFDPRNATIFLPRIAISDDTEIIFRNLMAFEACQASAINVISSYVFLMDELINTEKDAALLRKRGIIKSLMGSDKEVAQLFNSLGRHFPDSAMPGFPKLRKDVKEHHGNKRKVMLAEFRKEHCSRPWRILSVVAATLLLLMTAVQTIFSMYRS